MEQWLLAAYLQATEMIGPEPINPIDIEGTQFWPIHSHERFFQNNEKTPQAWVFLQEFDYLQ